VTGIGHRNHHVVSGSDIAVHAGKVVVEDGVAGLDGEFAAVHHRVAGVERKIADGVLELAWVDQRARRICREHQVDLDVLAQRRGSRLALRSPAH